MLAHTIPWDAEEHCWAAYEDDAMRTLYQPYARELGIGARPAVVAIDLYQLVFLGGDADPVELLDYAGTCGKFAHAAHAPIATVFSAARDLGVPIIHVTINRTSKVMATNRVLRQGLGTDIWDFQDGLAPNGDEIVVEKERASAFYGTPLVAELVRLGIDTVIVVGESTSGCVRASVVDSYSNGFHTVVVEDGVFDRSWANHCMSLFDLHHKYADVLSSTKVIQLLRS